MRFTKTEMPGVVLIELDEIRDERGFFARSFCADEFRSRGMHTDFIQSGISFNSRKGTVRGMHFQVAPKAEPKLIRCTRGAIHDVLVDLRPNSPTYLKTFEVELSLKTHRQLYVPPGIAHGFQTLEDETEVFYEIGETFSPEHARGVRWNDPAFKIQFPLPVTVISEKDQRYADYLL